MKPRKDNTLQRSKQSHSADNPNHFRFPHFLKPLGVQTLSSTNSDSSSTARFVPPGHTSDVSGSGTHMVPHSANNSHHLASLAGYQSEQQSGEAAAALRQFQQRLAAVDSHNKTAHGLMLKWRKRIATLGSPAPALGGSASVACDTILAELAMDVRRASVVAARQQHQLEEEPCRLDPSLERLVLTADDEAADNPNAYGPITMASLAGRRARGGLSRAGGVDLPMTVDHQEDIKALVAAGLLWHQYGSRVGGEATYYRLLSTLLDAAFREQRRGEDPNANLYTMVRRGEGSDGRVGQCQLEGGGGGSGGGSLVRRSYRELYNELVAKRRDYVGRPARVLERLGVQKSRMVLRLVFLAWRAGYRRRAHRLYEGGERADYLWRRRRHGVLRECFIQWRSHVRTHGRHRRVLQYHGSREKLIQRLARRVEALEAEKRSLTTDLAAIREDQREVQQDLLSLRRLVLGDADAEKFDRLVTDRRSKRRGTAGGVGLEELASTPCADGAVARADTPIDPPSSLEGAAGLPPARAISRGTPSPHHAQTVLLDYLRLMENSKEEGAAAKGQVVDDEKGLCLGDALVEHSRLPVAPLPLADVPPGVALPDHMQLLDWVAMRCQRMGQAVLAQGHGDSSPIAMLLSKRPRNFVSDFSDGARMAFILLSVGVSDRQLAEKVSAALSSEERRDLLQASFEEAVGVGSARIELTGSGCAKALGAVYARYQGTPVLDTLPPRGVSSSEMPSSSGPDLQRRIRAMKEALLSDEVGEAIGTGDATASTSDGSPHSSMECSLNSIYEKNFTEGELAAQSKALASDADTASDGEDD